jgi:hypothetical protein
MRRCRSSEDGEETGAGQFCYRSCYERGMGEDDLGEANFV